ncbi:hypothetical protein E3N88_24174 [Mikania micrantha]|uniref:Uncharacterized protein n=1 Tax=Mikania micrantha TaxID=192012 RepID=A0A5N6NH49_9ASTR|nr:hypothetical protein E3N88_24174 [Mikania micrantha]
MQDWAAPIIAAALFAFLAPGLVFQMPGNESPMGFMNMKTSVNKVQKETEQTDPPKSFYWTKDIQIDRRFCEQVFLPPHSIGDADPVDADQWAHPPDSRS